MGDLVRPGRVVIDRFRHALAEAIHRGLLEGDDPPLQHYHAQGVYGRRIFCKAGETVITKVHCQQHITIALKGTCTVYGQDGQRKTITAPDVFVTEPGTQRAVYCHDDVEWLTVHAAETDDVDELEQVLVADDFNEYDMRLLT